MIWPMMQWDRRSNPLQDWAMLHREMDRLLEAASAGPGRDPDVRVFANADRVRVIAAVPGMEPGKISVSVDGALLTLEGERAADAPKDIGWIRRERPAGRFARQVHLPFDVEESRVTARVRNGQIDIDLPRREASKPRTIEVKG